MMIVLATKKGDRVYEEAADETEKSKLGQKKLHPRDSCCSWIVCFSGVICLIIVLGCGYCFGIIFPVLLDVFHRGKSTTGEYLACVAGGMNILQAKRRT